MRSLIMLSGGLDSTYALVRLLRDTDDEVLAHHISCSDDSKRYLAEHRVVHEIIAYCRKEFRDFSFSLNAIDHRGMKADISDIILAAYEAGMVAASYFLMSGKTVRIDRWLVGHCIEKPWIAERADDARLLCHLNCQRKPEPALFLLDPLSQQEQVADMPEKLAAMAWSCRQPAFDGDKPIPCGRCDGCRRRALIAGMTTDAVAV